jgi:hypothetical protein
MRDSTGINVTGRWLLMAIGALLSYGLLGSSLFAHLVGFAGVLLFVTAIGLVELAMALVYRWRRSPTD